MNPTVSIGKTEMFKNLTPEQGRAFISGKKTVKVIASAGTGKTFTAMAYAAARPKARGLYMAFSKPAQEEAKHRLAKLQVNCEARTQHSLAWRSFGDPLSSAGKLQQRGGLRPGTTAELLSVNYKMASAINETLKNFMCTAEDRISQIHLPDEKEFPVVKSQGGAVMDGARVLWARMVNLSDKEVQATDDVYLKQWVMTNPILPYDYIIYDEAQDANALTAHLINMQKQASRLYIGDPHQSIFAFRGSINLMKDLTAEETHALTQSFRFTPNIGLLATTFLKHWKNSNIPIIGRGKGGPLSESDTTAYLSRTVGGLIAKGFELHEDNKKIHWVKGFDDYRAGSILEAYQLFNGQSGGAIKDPVLRRMGSWSEFEDYVGSSGDGESGPILRLINQHKHDTPEILHKLRQNQVLDPAQAKIVMTTQHKSKGLEWDVVRINHDHFSFKDETDTRKKNQRSGMKAATVWKTPAEMDEQELNLMYVTITRAKKAVVLPPQMHEWFKNQEATRHLFPGNEKAPGQDRQPEAQTPR